MPAKAAPGDGESVTGLKPHLVALGLDFSTVLAAATSKAGGKPELRRVSRRGGAKMRHAVTPPSALVFHSFHAKSLEVKPFEPLL